jgi:hypothetical protein
MLEMKSGTLQALMPATILAAVAGPLEHLSLQLRT